MSSIKIITTADGSHSLMNEALQETYHSVHGAVQESAHVFIQNGLRYYFEKHQLQKISILEVGFGTGLNALLAMQFGAQHNIEITYTTLEAYPLAEPLWRALNYPNLLGDATNFIKLHQVAWDTLQPITSGFELTKHYKTLQAVELPTSSFDVIFFDAFAPSKQPELWEQPMIRKVYLAMRSSGVFVTYCAKGQLKRDLKNLGLQTETLPGPPGKKEMVRAIKNNDGIIG